jgi:hypothetical protein
LSSFVKGGGPLAGEDLKRSEEEVKKDYKDIINTITSFFK